MTADQELWRNSGARIDGEVWRRSVPVLGGTDRLMAMGEIPGGIGTRSNLESVGRFTTWEDGVTEAARLVQVDAQTSGGLLIALPPDRARSLISLLEADREVVAVVGREISEGVG